MTDQKIVEGVVIPKVYEVLGKRAKMGSEEIWRVRVNLNFLKFYKPI